MLSALSHQPRRMSTAMPRTRDPFHHATLNMYMYVMTEGSILILMGSKVAAGLTVHVPVFRQCLPQAKG
jgi:hypothetical protein